MRRNRFSSSKENPKRNERYQYPRASPGHKRLRLLYSPEGLMYWTLRFRHSLGRGPIVMVPFLSLRLEIIVLGD